jgi:hypothetical protein
MAPSDTMKTCPECAESVQPAAKVCRYCGHRFDSTAAVPPPPEPTRSRSRFTVLHGAGALLVLAVAGIGAYVLLGSSDTPQSQAQRPKGPPIVSGSDAAVVKSVTKQLARYCSATDELPGIYEDDPGEKKFEKAVAQYDSAERKLEDQWDRFISIYRAQPTATYADAYGRHSLKNVLADAVTTLDPDNCSDVISTSMALTLGNGDIRPATDSPKWRRQLQTELGVTGN